MTDSIVGQPALSWRITAAEPTGMMMWFDPSCEQPLVGSLHSAACAVEATPVSPDGTLGLEWGEPGEGSAANESGVDSKAPQDPPEGFLASLWEGGPLDG